MGALNTKLPSNYHLGNTNRAVRPRRRDYRVVSVAGSRYLNSDFFSRLNDIDSRLSELSASAATHSRTSSSYLNVLENSRETAASKSPKQTSQKSQVEGAKSKNVTQARKSCVCGVLDKSTPVARHHSVNQIKSPAKLSNESRATNLKQNSSPPGSGRLENRRIQSNSQVNLRSNDFHRGDTGFVCPTQTLTDSSNITDKLAITTKDDLALPTEAFCPTSNNKLDARIGEQKSKFPQQSPTGDTQTTTNPRIFTSKPSNMRNSANTPNPTPRLSEKPPTPPPKAIVSKTPTTVTQNSNLSIRPNSTRRRASTPLCYSSSPGASQPDSTPSRSPSLRANSLPRPCSKADQWIRCPSTRSVPNSSTKPRGTPSIPKELDTDRQEKSTCLSRIEYTFYINDTETHQRPFYDRRVEAIARASQCNISLHKPLPGQKPVYYKGMRVLPVTISARTMVALKRCMARLDMQYPYFNVKAFCPPDMY